MKVQVGTESHKNAQALPDVDRLEKYYTILHYSRISDKTRFMMFQLKT